MGYKHVKKRELQYLYLLLFVCIFALTGFWYGLRQIRNQWFVVPDPPSKFWSSVMAIGDEQLAYRVTGLTLQNLGDSGGQVTPLKDYDFGQLKKWFFLADDLDPRASYVPVLAAYYFSAVQDASLLPPLIDYLEVVGARPGGERWRWLGQAAYLSRFRINDYERSVVLANKLAAMDDPKMPSWTDQLPAFMLAAKGDREEAIAFTLAILKEGAETLPPQEVFVMSEFLCKRLLTTEERKQYTFCDAFKE